MNIVNVNINDIIPYDKNPRFNDEAVEYVANSIKEFGFKVPVILDKNNVIITGHTRVKACEKLGIEEIPCIYADDLTEEQVKAFRLADNKVGEIADCDFELLNDELEKINLDMLDFGFMEEINFGEDFSNEIQYEEKDKKYTVKIEFDNEVEAEECLVGATIEILLYYVFAKVLKNVYLLGFIYALLSGTLVGAELFYVLGVPFVYSLATVGLSGLILYMAGVPFCKTILKRTAWK